MANDKSWLANGLAIGSLISGLLLLAHEAGIAVIHLLDNEGHHRQLRQQLTGYFAIEFYDIRKY